MHEICVSVFVHVKFQEQMSQLKSGPHEDEGRLVRSLGQEFMHFCIVFCAITVQGATTDAKLILSLPWSLEFFI